MPDERHLELGACSRSWLDTHVAVAAPRLVSLGDLGLRIRHARTGPLRRAGGAPGCEPDPREKEGPADEEGEEKRHAPTPSPGHRLGEPQETAQAVDDQRGHVRCRIRVREEERRPP